MICRLFLTSLVLQHACLWFQAVLVSSGFYPLPGTSKFYKAALQAGTDKVTKHNYHTIYAKYLEPECSTPLVHKMFEIGLGCNIKKNNFGRSAPLWRSYFPDAEIWFADRNEECIAKLAGRISELGIHMVVGNQANPNTLLSWVDKTKGNFDLIIDDGGHSNLQLYNSFLILFQHALRPGGLYVMEDIHWSRSEKKGKAARHSILDILKDWVEMLSVWSVQNRKQYERLAYTPKHKMPPGIKSIECFAEACVFLKCYANDTSCAYGAFVDHTLEAWPTGS